jgi:hypothetical protein
MNDSANETETATVINGELVESVPSRELAVQHANPYLSMIDRVIDRGGDIANVERLLDLQLKWDANEARKAFVAAMAAFKAEPMEILKRKTVEFSTRDGDTTRYTHAELSDVTDAVVPAMGKHGLSHRWDVQQAGGQITVTCTITHALGHSESVSMTAAPDASGKKNAIQQVASTTTYLQRYTLLAATGMATKGMDDDGRRSEGEEEEEADQSWLDGIDACVDQHGLKGLKAEMVEAFGSAKAIPKDLIRAYNAKWAEVAEPAKA